MLIALLVCTFLFTVLLLGQLRGLLTRRQLKIEERLRLAINQNIKPQAVSDKTGPGRRVNRWIQSVTVPSALISKKYMDKMQVNLVKAGLPLKAQELVSFMFVSGLACLGLGLLIFHKFAFGILAGILGLCLPGLWVSYLKKNRVKILEGQLLDTVLLLANSLRAGHSFLQALELVSRETPPPLSVEFGRVIREIRIGIPVEEALTNLAQRVESKDVEMLVTGVLIQRQVGGNLAEVLDAIAATIDKRIKMRAKIRALTAQGRLSAWIISLLPIALAAFIFGKNPDFGRIMLVNPIGIALLVAGAVMLMVGILLVRKVVTIDV
mgnify:CR=1 FL=1